MATLAHPEAETKKDFLPLNGTDYVEFYVGNARQSAYFYGWPSATSWLPMPGRRRGIATAPPTCCSRARCGWC